MPVAVPGDKALDIIQGATGSVLIVAPYIKTRALQRMLSALPNDHIALTCITRWLPEDIASGVCDLEIFEQINDRKKAQLMVHPHLHAKYYRADERCLVGSANLTKRGLGWATPSNVELLVEVPFEFEGLADWEAELLRAAIPADAELRDRIGAQAEELKQTAQSSPAPEVGEEEDESQPAQQWVPSCPVPENLWIVYKGGGADKMVTSAYEAATADLAAISPPSGLSHSLFEKYVSGILRQMPLMAEIDQLASNGLTDSQAYAFLTENIEGDLVGPVDQTWRVLKEWLTHFFPATYRLEVGQEVLVKGSHLKKDVK